MKTMFPKTVIWGGGGWVSSEGDIMQSQIFKQCLRFKSNGYVEWLNTVVELGEGGCLKAICVTTRFSSWPPFQKESDVVAKSFLRFHQS